MQKNLTLCLGEGCEKRLSCTRFVKSEAAQRMQANYSCEISTENFFNITCGPEKDWAIFAEVNRFGDRYKDSDPNNQKLVDEFYDTLEFVPDEKMDDAIKALKELLKKYDK